MGFLNITEAFQNLVIGAANSFVSTTVTLQSATDDSERFTPEVTEAAKLGQDERDEAWRVRDALTPQVSALEYSEHAIIEDDPFDAMSHAEIFERVGRMDPATLDAIGQSWTVIAERTANGVNQFQNSISTAIGEGWQGKGGSAALAAVLAYSENGNQLKTRVQLISNKVSEARIVLDEVKRSIPAPDGASSFESLISLIPGATRNQVQYEAEEAERRARQVMKDVYLPNMRRADDQVPILPAAFNPITGDGGGGGYPGSGSGTGSGGGSNAYSLPTGKAENGDFRESGGSGQGGSGQSGAGEGAVAPGYSDEVLAGGRATVGGDAFDVAPQDDSNAGGNSGGTDSAGAVNSDGPAGTTAASAGGPNLLAGANPAGVGGTPHSNAFGAGVGASPSGGAGSGSPGGSGLGAGGGAFGSGGGGGALAGGGRGAVGGIGSNGIGPGGGGVGGNGTGGGSANGRSPMMGGMGGMAVGRGQGKDDDDTHQTPGYLINIDNGNTLIGELPMVTPSVLGE